MNRQKPGLTPAARDRCLEKTPQGKLTLLAAALTLLTLVGGRANASFDTNISVTVTPQSGGIFLYTYTATVLPASTSALSEFDLNLNDSSLGPLSPGADISAITQPAGFLNLYTTSDPYISYLSTASSSDIQPGASGIFSFTSPISAGLQPYLFRSFDNSGNVFQTAGQVLAPFPGTAAAVPEPSGLFALGLGLAGTFVLRARRRSHLSAN